MKLALPGIAAAAGLLAWGFTANSPALAGWLIGLQFWLGIALGAYVVLAIHALTGGLWLAPLFRVLAPAVLTLPCFAVVMLPPLLDPGAVWPWIADPEVVKRAAVRAWYLNPPGFTLRTVIALLGWSALGVLLVASRARRPWVGGAALVFHGFALTWFGLDWILSLTPGFRSTVFGGALGVSQLLAALGWAALLEPEPAGFRGKAGDLARLILAAALGAIYLGFAQFLVAWYGNLPDKAAWFLRREALPWIALEFASVALSAALPIAALLPQVTRRSPRALAWVGGGVLVGVWLHTTWLIGPQFGPEAIATGLLGTAAIGSAWLGLVRGPLAGHPGRRLAHGR